MADNFNSMNKFNKNVRIKSDTIYCDNSAFYKFNRKNLYKEMMNRGCAKKDLNKLLKKIIKEHSSEIENVLNEKFESFICENAHKMRGQNIAEKLGIL